MNITLFALRNTGRSPKKTLVNVCGIASVCAVMIIWGSIAGGFSEKLYNTATALVLGELQIHHEDYLDSESIYDTTEFDENIYQQIRQQGFHAAPKLFGYALAAVNDVSFGIQLIGIDPLLEESVSSLHTHLSQGEWLDAQKPQEVLIGNKVAKAFNLHVGSEIVVLGQAADGSLASEVFRVRGVLKKISQGIDSRSVYLNISAYRQFFYLASGVHEVTIKREEKINHLSLHASKNRLSAVSSNASIKTWKDRKPVLSRVLDLLSFSIYFTLGFTYIALGGLILNLMLLSIYDRFIEYGTMKALGSSPRQIVLLIVIEALWMAIAAAILGVAIGLPVSYYLQRYGLDFSFIVDHMAISGLVLEPILFAKIGLKQVVSPIIFLLCMTPFAALYPALKASDVSCAVAMKGG